jgi:DNA-binding transcriptional MocR family regulator
MPTKWEVQAAVLNSELSSTGRLLMHTLLTRANAETAVIAAEHSPSLSELARESGMDKRTVTRTMPTLEVEGWVRRKVPTLKESRKGARTRYALLVGLGAHNPHPGAGDPQAGGTEPPGVGAHNPQPRGTQPLNRDPSPSSPSIHPRAERQQAEIDLVITVLKERTGRDITPEHAHLVIGQIADNRQNIRNRLGWIKSILLKDDSPERFLPTPAPPAYVREST